jgi:hypothetical protein
VEVQIMDPNATADEVIGPIVPLRPKYAVAISGRRKGLPIPEEPNATSDILKGDFTALLHRFSRNGRFCEARSSRKIAQEDEEGEEKTNFHRE